MADTVDTAPAQDPARLQAEVARLKKVVQALMNRVERGTSAQGSSFNLFQTTVVLEEQVRSRTRELESSLRDNERINRDLQRTQDAMEAEITERKRIQLALEDEREVQQRLIAQLEDAHCQLLQSEKLASIGQLAAGVAHEINNPIGFVNSNLNTLKGYVSELLQLIAAYETLESVAQAHPPLAERMRQLRQGTDLDYLRQDIPELLAETIDGTTRVRRIVQDLRDFSRTGEVEWEWADLHAGLDSTLNVVSNEIKYQAEVVREYGDLPLVECLPTQLNQVFMNLLVNAAQAMPVRGTITLRTGHENGWVAVSIADTGSGISADNLRKIFDPFFTTKPVGKGTGLGLSVSYGIVEKHGGRIDVKSVIGEGTTFTVMLPVRRGEAAPQSAEPRKA